MDLAGQVLTQGAEDGKGQKVPTSEIGREKT
jgi:hypothetical protein